VAAGDFSAQAEAYARARPGYPLELVRELARAAGVRPGHAVADVGAGTGIFAGILAELGFAVTAIEPNAAMRARVPHIAGVTVHAGTFEATGLADGSQRWVTAAQAFHWADPPRALPEMRRVLAPGGALTVLWNDRENERSPALAFAAAAIRRAVPGWDEAYRGADWSAVLRSTGDFTRVVTAECRHVVTMSRARFLDLWRSHHRLMEAAGPGLFAELLAEIAAFLDGERIEAVEVPYVCRAWTATR